MGRMSTNPAKLGQINPELSMAVEKLQRAKKWEIDAAIELCLKLKYKYDSPKTIPRTRIRSTKSPNVHAESQQHCEEVPQDEAAMLPESEDTEGNKYGTAEPISQALIRIMVEF